MRNSKGQFIKGNVAWTKTHGNPNVIGEKNPMKSDLNKKKVSEKMKGNKNNFGNKASEETNKKRSIALKGKKLSKEHIQKLKEVKRKKGKDCHNWKGGLTSINKTIRNSVEFRQWRKSVFENDNFVCQMCKKRGGKLNAHHLKSFSEYPNNRFDIHNGITLCQECHFRLHRKPKEDLRTAFVDVLIELAEKDKAVVLLTGDLGFSFLERFRDKFPEQYINCGLAEQNLIGVSTGLALAGKKPYVYSRVNFLLFRPYEQVRTACYHSANIKLIGVMGKGKPKNDFLGFTHNSYFDEDVIVLAKLPNLSVNVPTNSDEVKYMIKEINKQDTPAYIRI